MGDCPAVLRYLCQVFPACLRNDRKVLLQPGGCRKAGIYEGAQHIVIYGQPSHDILPVVCQPEILLPGKSRNPCPVGILSLMVAAACFRPKRSDQRVQGSLQNIRLLLPLSFFSEVQDEERPVIAEKIPLILLEDHPPVCLQLALHMILDIHLRLSVRCQLSFCLLPALGLTLTILQGIENLLVEISAA